MSDHRHSKEDALDRVQYLDLYRAALRIDDPYTRLAAIVMVLCSGRLGMRIGEVIHLHEGWINWRKGYIAIPTFEPCGCRYCWKRSKRNFDPEEDAADDYIEYHAHNRWSPKSDMGARILPFNWSLRITAALEAFFSEYTVIDENYKWAERAMKDKILPNAEFLDPGDLMWHGLRSTSVTFWADADLDTKALRDSGGWVREADSNPYRAQSPTQLANKMRDVVGKDPVEFGTTDFVALDPRSLAGEPFDPRDTDPRSRADPYQRGPVRNPREANPPDEVDYEQFQFASLAAERDPPTPAERRAFVRRVEAQRDGDLDADVTDPYLDAMNDTVEKHPGQARMGEFLGPDEDGTVSAANAIKLAYLAAVLISSWGITFG